MSVKQVISSLVFNLVLFFLSSSPTNFIYLSIMQITSQEDIISLALLYSNIISSHHVSEKVLALRVREQDR